MEHEVALVPGFLGFKNYRGQTYFADRFTAALRANIEVRTGRTVPVVAVPTSPIGSLAVRQKRLSDALERRRARTPGRALHLVGHSTGGLDASLLTRTEKLVCRGPKQPSEFSGDLPEVPGLRTVTTIAAPHYGTTLALAPLPRMTVDRQTVQGWLDLGQLTVDVLLRDEIEERLRFALGALNEGKMLDFLLHLFFNDELARDLEPANASALTERRNARDVQVFSIATWVPAPGPQIDDDLFRRLWTWTHDAAAGAPAVPRAFPDDPQDKLIRPAGVPIPREFGAGDNDGVVNTDRQIFGQFAGLVVGDHGDVIGRYRRPDPENPDRKRETGLLTSGAEFTDETFFQLIARVADGIVASIRAAP